MRSKRAKFSAALLICFILIFTLMSVTYAHPGRTDKNGGHYVRTAGYGYTVGSYHYHNGGSTTTKSISTNNYSYKVFRIQNRLNDLGYNCGTPDGYTGSQTKNAIIMFQKANGLVADGVVGSKTNQILFSDSAIKAGSTTSAQVSSQTEKKEIIVYITKTGKKYHQGSCSYLSKSKIATKLVDAKSNGYTPCSRCNPPR